MSILSCKNVSVNIILDSSTEIGIGISEGSKPQT